MSLLGLDIGTSATKGILLDDRGRFLAEARRGYRPRASEPGGAELSASRVWSAARAVIGALATLGEARGSPVRAVCAGGSGDEVVAVDARGRPVGPVIMAMDQRSVAEGRELAEACGVDALFAHTGLWDLTVSPVARYRWLQHHEPARAARVARLLSWPEWVATRLGLPPAVDPTLAARTLAYDLTTGAYAQGSCAARSIPDSLLSPVVPTGTLLGTVPPGVAGLLSLRAGTCYVVGGFDQAMATLGSGAVDAGVAHDGGGSWEALSVRLPGDDVDPRLRGDGWSVGPSAAGDRALEAMASWPAGLVLRWAGALVTDGIPNDRALARALDRVPPGPPRLIASVGLAEPGAPPLGGAGAFVGLDLGVRHHDLLHALIDGLSHRLRRAVLGMAALGVPVTRIRATGGGARSDRWLQLKADTTGVPVERPAIAQAGAFAAAILAGDACGVLPPVSDAIRDLVRVDARFEPDPAVAARQAERAGRHAALATALGSLADPAPPA